MRKRSKVSILKELLRKVEYTDASFGSMYGATIDGKEMSGEELNAWIKSKIDPYFRSWVQPLVRELLEREQQAASKRRSREASDQVVDNWFARQPRETKLEINQEVADHMSADPRAVRSSVQREIIRQWMAR